MAVLRADLRVKRGLKADLPFDGEIGEVFFTTDSRELHVGAGAGLPLEAVAVPALAGLPFNFLGSWDSATDYLLGDLVVFDNELYVGLNDSTDDQPDTHPANWATVLIAPGPTGPRGLKGDKGDAGAASTVPGPRGSTQLTSVAVFPTNSSTLIPIAVNFATSGDNVVVPGIVGKTIAVWKLLLVSGASTILTFFDGSTPQSGPLVGKLTIVLDLSDRPWYSASAGNDLIINQVTNAPVGGTLWVAYDAA